MVQLLRHDQIRAKVEVETSDESNEFPELHREVIPEVVVEGPDAGEEASGQKKSIQMDELTETRRPNQLDSRIVSQISNKCKNEQLCG